MRLIDADALVEEFEKSCADNSWWFESRVENAPTANQWIKCSDKMPPVRHDVLLFIPHKEIVTGWHSGKTFFKSGVRSGISDKAVTHWMPLPEPPKAD